MSVVIQGHCLSSCNKGRNYSKPLIINEHITFTCCIVGNMRLTAKFIQTDYVMSHEENGLLCCVSNYIWHIQHTVWYSTSEPFSKSQESQTKNCKGWNLKVAKQTRHSASVENLMWLALSTLFKVRTFLCYYVFISTSVWFIASVP